MTDKELKEQLDSMRRKFKKCRLKRNKLTAQVKGLVKRECELVAALESAKPKFTTAKNSSAVRSGHEMSGSIMHYEIEPHILHVALNKHKKQNAK